jgi:hypothetical protein
MADPKKDRHIGVAIFSRVPAAIHKALKEEATTNRRTVGKQLCVILEERYPSEKQA